MVESEIHHRQTPAIALHPLRVMLHLAVANQREKTDLISFCQNLFQSVEMIHFTNTRETNTVGAFELLSPSLVTL